MAMRASQSLSVAELRGSGRRSSGASDMSRQSSKAYPAPPSAEKESRYHVEEGVVLRQESEQRRNLAQEKGSERLEKSNEAIRERIKQTNEQKQDILRDVLEHSETFEKLIGDLTALTEMEAELVSKIRQILRERQTRPLRESQKDEVDFWLKTLQGEAEASLFPKFLSDLHKIHSTLTKISPELTQAIEDKADSVVVDLECLSMDSGNVSDKTVTKPAKRDKAHLEPGSTRRQLEQTKTLLQRADLLVQKATSIEQKLEAYRNRRLSGEAAPTLLEVYQAKVDSNQESASQLQECLDEVEADLESCIEELEELSGCISEQSSNLQVTQTRLRTRQNKPARERVRDAADRALENEEDSLMKTITKLHVQQKKLTNNRQRLQTSIEELKKQLFGKEDALRMDTESLEMLEALLSEFNSVMTPS